MRNRPALILGALTLGVGIAAFATLTATAEDAEERPYAATLPFAVRTVARFSTPWAVAPLPDDRLLVTERDGHLFLVTGDGARTEVSNLPAIELGGQLGLLDVAPAPDYAESGAIYLSYSAPGDGGAQITLARAVLRQGPDSAHLAELTEIWRQPQASHGGHPGAIIAFDPAGAHVFLTLGDRTETGTAQDPDIAQGKILRLALDGSTPADNPWAAEGGLRAQLWTTGHRNPYGLAFAAGGRLWEHEMGPRGGDEINLIEPGQNYGWGEVSEGVDYDMTEIPNHATRPEFTAPAFAWGTGTAPAGMAFYQGAMFPDWEGSILLGALAGSALVRVAFGPDGRPAEAERWDMLARIRDVAVAPDGAIWLIEDEDPGRLLRLTPR